MQPRSIEFRILGPIEAVVDGRTVELGPKQRALLALLLVNAGRVVPTDRIVEVLWGGRPPASAASTLRSHLSRLRSTTGASIESRPPGYVLRLEPGQLDAERFEELLARGRAALDPPPDTAAATGILGRALGLWRGPALAELDDRDGWRDEAARLEDLRVAAVELHLTADLELGREAEVAAEIEALVGEHPYREGLWRLLMLALYRAGRQAEALAAYGRARERFAGDLGLDVGPALAELQRSILRHHVPDREPRLPAAVLPTPLTRFVGRTRELAEVTALLGRSRLVTAHRRPSGKTPLAVAAAASDADTAFLDLPAHGNDATVAPSMETALAIGLGAAAAAVVVLLRPTIRQTTQRIADILSGG